MLFRDTPTVADEATERVVARAAARLRAGRGDRCPHVRTVIVAGDSRIDPEHLARVLALRYALRLAGVYPDARRAWLTPAPRTPAARGVRPGPSRLVRWLNRCRPRWNPA